MNMSAHAQLTEHSLRAPIGKGREGKGVRKGRGGRVETSHPFVQLGDERARRFWAKVKFAPGDLCWEWMGEINHRGYGRFTFRNVRTVAHRVAYELVYGPIPEGLQGGHLCHNTRCVRPDHIEAMTCAKNIAQRDERLGRPAIVSPERMRKRERDRRYWERKRARKAASKP